MTIIVGLGNPGEKFKKTRHNVGFMALDDFGEKNLFPEFKLQKKSSALVSEHNSVLLAKPQTFMNESGTSARNLVKNSFSPDSFVVIHDDIDLPLGIVKVVKNSGAGGHKGVASIIESLGTQNFIRIKIGICPAKGKPANVETFVVKNFTKDEKEAMEHSIEKSSMALSMILNDGVEKAMNEYNRQ